MIHAYQIVADVLDKFRGLPMKLAAMNGKSHQWFSSHGAEPRSVNPLSSGNVSEVEHYMRFARKYEAGANGAGLMLSRRVADALEAEFTEPTHVEVHQSVIEVDVIEQGCDVQKWLARHDIDDATARQLVAFISECNESEDAIANAKARATARLKTLRMPTFADAQEVTKLSVASRRAK